VINLFPGFVEDGHALARDINISFRINRHAVRAERAEKSFVRERAIRLEVVAPRLRGADVRDKKFFVVRRAGDAIRFFQIVRRAF
jgi:hypothetical protein